MQLAQFRRGGRRVLAAACGPRWLDLTGAYARRLQEAGDPDPLSLAEAVLPREMTAFLGRGAMALALARETLQSVQARLEDGREVAGPDGEPLLFDAGDVRWEPPVTRPGKLLCVGNNYRDRCREAGVPIPGRPVFFSKPQTALLPHGAPLELPSCSQQVDFEAELAVVVGRRCRNLSSEEAPSAIAGYTILNDVTARDLQAADARWTRAKGLDGFAPMGPVLVTADEVPDPGRLRIRLWLNGRLMQDAPAAEMIFSIPELLAAASRDMTLEPGDVLATGTPAGVGAAQNPPAFLQPGDQIRIEIEGIGRLENPVIQPRVRRGWRADG